MFAATGGGNAHRGAIWCLGLLVAAAAFTNNARSLTTSSGSINHEPIYVTERLVRAAAQLAAIPYGETTSPQSESHGMEVSKTFGFGGARAQAINAFPHVTIVGLPYLHKRRLEGAGETVCQLDALFAIMSTLDDTCLLYRGGLEALLTAQDGAKEILEVGGTGAARGMERLYKLDQELLALNASPGGSADLLAATLFLDALTND